MSLIWTLLYITEVFGYILVSAARRCVQYSGCTVPMERSAPDRVPCGPSVWPSEPARIRRWTAPPHATDTDTSAQWGFLVQRQWGGYSPTGITQHQQCNAHMWDRLLVKWRIWNRDFLPVQGSVVKFHLHCVMCVVRNIVKYRVVIL